jgi:hypothetical protein
MEVRAFPNPRTQVAEFVTRLVAANRDRTIKNARITSKLNSERPHDTNELRSAGLGWKSNFTTRPLGTLMQRAYSRFPRAIHEAKHLTAARLDSRVPYAKEKSEFFRDEVTKFVRSEPRWKDFVEGIAWEDVSFGWAAALWLDEESWLPVAARQDELYVPSGTKQYSSTAGALVFRQEMLPHEAYSLLLKAAKTVPENHENIDPTERPVFEWNLPEFAKVINGAIAADQKSQTDEQMRSLEDLRRQMTMANTFGAGNKMVTLYHCLVAELDGSVSHYIVGGEQKGFIFSWESRFVSMDKCAAFFAFELGDRTLLGSKGVGRLAYTIAGVLDRSSNDVVDRFQLSGKVFAKAPEARHRRFRLSVVGNVVLVDDNFEMLPAVKIEAAVTDSISLDRFLQAKLDGVAGTVSPNELSGERVTAAAVQLLASREGERQDEVSSRFLQQFGGMMTELTRRLVLADTQEPKVLALRSRLASRLTAEEIEYLASVPAMTTIQGWTNVERQLIVLACSEARGVPVYDQRKVEVAKVTAQVGQELADDLILSENDPTLTAEQVRLQTMENHALLDGAEIPVSPRDAHMLHLQTLMPIIGSSVEEAMQNPAALTSLNGFVVHARAHVEMGKQSAIPGIEAFDEAITQIEKAIVQVQQAEADEAAAPVDPNAGEPPVDLGTPMTDITPPANDEMPIGDDITGA